MYRNALGKWPCSFLSKADPFRAEMLVWVQACQSRSTREKRPVKRESDPLSTCACTRRTPSSTKLSVQNVVSWLF